MLDISSIQNFISIINDKLIKIMNLCYNDFLIVRGECHEPR